VEAFDRQMAANAQLRQGVRSTDDEADRLRRSILLQAFAGALVRQDVRERSAEGLLVKLRETRKHTDAYAARISPVRSWSRSKS